MPSNRVKTSAVEPSAVAYHASADVLSLSLPRVLATRHHTADLTGQFVLARGANDLPEWPLRRLAGWQLASHPVLPVCELMSADGVVLGWLVGYAIDSAGRMVGDRIGVPFSRDITPAQFESFLYTFGGRFLAVLVTPRAERVYLDPVGSLGAIYSPEHEMVAATTTLVPYSRGCDDDSELIRDTGIPYRNGVYPFGLTPRMGVYRIIPNHYLDLRSWQTQRHWLSSSLDEVIDPHEAIRTVGEIVRRHVRAVTAARPAYVALTAGNDSRMVAACTREVLDRVHFMTLALPDDGAQMDCEMARRIMRRVGLPHEIVPFVEPSPDQIDDWLWRTGGMIGEWRGQQATGMYQTLDASRAELTGQAGELCRAAYWHELKGPREATVEGILDVLDAPSTPRIVACATQWLRSLPTRDPVMVYDLLHLEQWLGCWGGVLPYGDTTAVAFRVYPLAHRESIECMLRLPRRYKIAERFPRDFVAANWPELLSVPFNRYPGTRHYVRRARRRVWLIRRSLASHGIQI